MGYRSRSAFKLIELDKKFKFFKKKINLLDIGSSPIGWSQVAQEKIQSTGKIISVDIKDMEAIDNIHFINADFQKKKLFKKFHHFLKEK